MALAHSPKIVKDGLVFAYDMGNPAKSWKGAPATNLITETNLNNWSKTAITATYNLQTPFKAQTYAITDNNTGSYLSISRNITVANDSSSYTTSLFVKKTTGSTSARLGFNIGFNTGGTTVSVNARFNSDTGVANTGTVVSQGDWWYWYFTISNNGTGNTNLTCAFYPATGLYNSSDNVIGVGTAIIGELMIVAGSVPARFVSGTRSNTQALLDLTRNNTITADSLTYNTDDTFSFNGSSNYISTSFVGNTSAFTHEVFLRPTDVTKDQMYIGYNAITAHYVRIVGSQAFLSVRAASVQRTLTHPQVLANNTNYHIVSCYNGVQLKIYVNGVLASGSVIDQPLDGWGINRIGRWQDGDQRAFVGTIFNLKTYDRELTAAEVAQNYNTLKGRYGI